MQTHGMNDEPTTFHEKLSRKIDRFVHGVYDATEMFPKQEMFGATSQIRRAALSVALNVTEGNARYNKKEFRNFVRIAYGSLKETLYLIRFAHERAWIADSHAEKLETQGDELGKMLWSILSPKHEATVRSAT